jgi:2-polyprenyl-3-methyl-5-hydroxy-6-metoxy-1,4-benzoquinol methylase
LQAVKSGIDGVVLRQLHRHNGRLGLHRVLKSIGYERSAELSYVVGLLQDRFDRPLDFLDIGTGDSVLPSFFLARTSWNIWCVDKFSWVRKQSRYGSMVAPEKAGNLHVIEQDFLDFQPESQFDVISCISVIEHFEGDLDSRAMAKAATLLRPGGVLIVTTPVNEGYSRSFFRAGKVYGAYSRGGTFYQRHYDAASLRSRLIAPSGLSELHRIYFGEFGFPFGEKFLFPRLARNPFKVFYKWLAPYFAERFLSYSDSPIGKHDMPVDTASGAILVLQKA